MLGVNNCILHWQAVAGGAEITAVETGDEAVDLPETIAGLPVVALGRHAFAPGQGGRLGTALRVACGGKAQVDPDPRRIRRVALPPTVRRVGDYAFYNCTGLEQLSVSEPVEYWGGGVFMNCRSLHRFSIRMAAGGAESAAYFADELPGELDMTLSYPDGGVARLIFPEYRESYEENSPAHHFDFHLYGPGYPYHHVFRRKALPMAEYDGLFPGMLAMEHEPDCAMRLAWYRLRFPRELGDAAAARYLDYLKSRCGHVLGWLLAERDSRGLAWFLPRCGGDREALSAAAESARRLGLSEMLALVLEQQHRQFSGGLEKAFDL